jgi:hypothetical protein
MADAKRAWRGDAPDVAQVDVVYFEEDPVITEGSDLDFTINDKTIRVSAPDSIEDEADDVEGDTGGMPAILLAAEAAINASEIPEFAEIEAAVETLDDDEEAPHYRLRLTGREAGKPFTLAVDSPLPSVDIDVVQEGGPGVNEIQQFWIDPAPEGGTYVVRWNLGLGLESSGAIAHDGDAAAVKAAMVAGMASITADNLTVSGTGTEEDPFVLELLDDLAETNVGLLSVDVSTLTGNGAVTINTVQQGGEAVGGANAVTDSFTDSNGTALTSHVPDTGDGWTDISGAAGLTIESNKLQCSATSVQRRARLTSDISTDVEISGTINFATSVADKAGGFLLRILDSNNYIYAAIVTGYLFIFKVEGGSTTQLAAGTVLHSADTNYTLTASVGGNTISVSSDLDSISANSSFNNTQQKHGVVFIGSAGDGVITLDDLIVDEVVFSNEVQQVYHNGSGGSLELTFGGQTATIPAGSTAAEVDTLLTALSSIDSVDVSGSGTPADPWEVEFTGSHAGTNIAQMTGDGTDLTGGYSATVETEQDGSPPLPTIWSVYTDATGGNLQLEFNGRETGNLAYNANAAAVEAALVAIEPGDFAGLFDVTGAGTFADPWIITAAGRLEGEAQTLTAHNEDLTGDGPTIVHETIQAPTGRHWPGNANNWRDVDTGLPGLPENGDHVILQEGDETNSLLYGLDDLAAIDLASFKKSSLFQGSIGLPTRTETGYVEYRPTALEIGFQAGASFDDPNIVIGNERGPGSGRVKLKTGAHEVHIRVERTGGPLDEGFQSFQWAGQNANSTLQLIEGFAGVASFAFEEAELAKIVQRGGVLHLGEGTVIDAGSTTAVAIDKTGGDLYNDGAQVTGRVLLRG